jgi:hypothetical protein
MFGTVCAMRRSLVLLFALAGVLLPFAQAGATPRRPLEPFLATAQGAVPLKFNSGGGCRARCWQADGRPGPAPLALVRERETVVFKLPRPYDVVRVRAGLSEAVELGPGKNATWQVPAAGSYDVSLFIKLPNETAIYSLRLRVTNQPLRHVPQ